MLKAIFRIATNLELVRPKEYVNNISEIDYVKLSEKGIKYIVYDKDNTLTL